MANFLASGATFQATEGSNSDFHDGETFYFYDCNSSDLVDFFKLWLKWSLTSLMKMVVTWQNGKDG